MGVVESVNGNIKSLLRRGRGYKNLRYLLLKAQRMAATKDSCAEPYKQHANSDVDRASSQYLYFFSAGGP
jgi:hypothetical protein